MGCGCNKNKSGQRLTSGQIKQQKKPSLAPPGTRRVRMIKQSDGSFKKVYVHESVKSG